jgi:hypothetical protein
MSMQLTARDALKNKVQPPLVFHEHEFARLIAFSGPEASSESVSE